MKKTIFLLLLFFSFIVLVSSSSKPDEPAIYISFYKKKVTVLREKQVELLTLIQKTNQFSATNITLLLNKIAESRLALKETDFWFRYFEPVAYKKINGPLPVEWETEVFEKHEAPYQREGAGLTLAELYLSEEDIEKDSLIKLVKKSIQATDVFLTDSITDNLNTQQHFFLANRLFLLNLAAIYSTGFECPDTSRVIPELFHLLKSTAVLYSSYNQSFPSYRLNDSYTALFDKTIDYVKNQPKEYTAFDHFGFIQNFVNPLYQLNQQMILGYAIRSMNFNDFSLNKQATSIFDKSLYRGQNKKGVFIGIDDQAQQDELKAIGKLLFYDPILSLNNQRSCASCHKPTQFFTDTTVTAHLQFDRQSVISRNTPTLINSAQNHLIMLDGKHISLENQAKDVITNPLEMGSHEEEVLKKVMSCNNYKTVFKKYLSTTPQYKSVNLEHITSAIMLYYTDFSSFYSGFDHAIAEKKPISDDVKKGFNLFMSKAQCGTCHFVPQFNGTKPPYIGSEFEVIGVPADTSFTRLSSDKGRYQFNPAKETQTAFRTGSVRNAARTMPYMHNGVFRTLEEVIDFYDAGGGAGRGLAVSNQTLSADSLKLTKKEKKAIIAFINSLNEEIPLQVPPLQLPVSKNKELNNRVIGGEY